MGLLNTIFQLYSTYLNRIHRLRRTLGGARFRERRALGGARFARGCLPHEEVRRYPAREVVDLQPRLFNG